MIPKGQTFVTIRQFLATQRNLLQKIEQLKTIPAKPPVNFPLHFSIR